MNPQCRVFILILAGQQHDAVAFARQRYPGCDAVVLSKTELRESGWKRQLRVLRRLKGKALLIFADSLESLHEPLLLKWTVLVHQCQETILADSSGSFEVTRRARFLGLLPRTFFAAFADLILFAFTWLGLQLFRVWLRLGRKPQEHAGLLDLAFLCPFQAGLDTPGGALTHVTGFLSGLMEEGARVAVFSGRPLQTACEMHKIPGSRPFHLLREASSLAYNLRFIAAARKPLAKKKPRLLYQRHGKFLFAGAILSRLLRIPLVLEYNGSEDWIAKHWDPSRFAPWLRLCEAVSIRAASLVVVVSKPLKQQLMEIGVPEERILVNPNAVDPQRFSPNCGGARLREQLGFRVEDVVVCFVGTFSYWHGVAVLEQAIRSLQAKAQHANSPLKFLLVGDGPLAPQLRQVLGTCVPDGLITFTGAVPHHSVCAYLDAADILVSPHVPMPGGRPFFGSPTKLFEYMAMGKAIAASALDQIADVLEHGKTALLVKPGDVGELTEAIQHLASDSKLRIELGRNAREAALTRHTWRGNARRVLAVYQQARLAPTGSEVHGGIPVGSTPSRRTNLARQTSR
jgi:glycosyltransferase involved in cell wall biosynthesis